MSLQVTYLGGTTIGASDQNPNANVVYTVPMTAPGDGWLTAIEVAIHSGGGSGRIGVGLYADSGGEPGELLAVWGHSAVGYAMSSTPRFVTFPVMYWVTAGAYHIGATSISGVGDIRIRVDTGGSSGDGHTIGGGSSTITDGDYSSATITATTSTYSIRGVFVEEAAPQPPPAPTNPTASPQAESSIIVEWDGSTGATGYRVERSANGTTGWTDVSGNLPANPTDFGDNGLTCSTQYFYRVFAFNNVGDSPPSSVVNTTTDACTPSSGNRMGGTGAIRRRGGHPR